MRNAQLEQLPARLAHTERSRAFYAKYGFESLTDDRLHMYLPMATARELVQQQSD